MPSPVEPQINYSYIHIYIFLQLSQKVTRDCNVLPKRRCHFRSIVQIRPRFISQILSKIDQKETRILGLNGFFSLRESVHFNSIFFMKAINVNVLKIFSNFVAFSEYELQFRNTISIFYHNDMDQISHRQYVKAFLSKFFQAKPAVFTLKFKSHLIANAGSKYATSLLYNEIAEGIGSFQIVNQQHRPILLYNCTK